MNNICPVKPQLSLEDKQMYHDFCAAIGKGEREKIDDLITKISNFDEVVDYKIKTKDEFRKVCALQLAAMKQDVKTVNLILSKICGGGTATSIEGNIARCLVNADLIDIKINARIFADSFKVALGREDEFTSLVYKPFPYLPRVYSFHYRYIDWTLKQGEVLHATHLREGITLFQSEVQNEVVSKLSCFISIPPLVSIIFDYYFNISFEGVTSLANAAKTKRDPNSVIHPAERKVYIEKVDRISEEFRKCKLFLKD